MYRLSASFLDLSVLRVARVPTRPIPKYCLYVRPIAWAGHFWCDSFIGNTPVGQGDGIEMELLSQQEGARRPAVRRLHCVFSHVPPAV
jgi:hypothetical protein